MEDLTAQEEAALRAQLEQARQTADGLIGELRGVESELEQIATERNQFALLDQVCGGLDALREMGAAGLFWGGGAVDAEATVGRARERVSTFQKGLDEIETRRQTLGEELDRAQESVEILEDELDEAQHRAEMRKLEWVIERDVELPFAAAVMPWTRGGEDDERFWKALAAAMLASLLFGLVFPWIPLPAPEVWETVEVPDRLTRLVEQRRPLPPPPPVQETKPTEPEELEPEPAKELLAEEPTPQAAPTESPQPSAASKGILAFREKFSNLAENVPDARLGAAARIDDSGQAATGRPTRSMVTTQAPGSSGGINLASLSRNTGGGGNGIAGVEVARATSSIGSGTGTGTDRPLAGGPGLGRTDEEIQIVFDRHKAALYRLYNRELRRDPTLRGQMVLRLTIEPDGSVSLCEVQSNGLRAPDLAAQVVARVKTFDFGAKEVPALTILYPIDFLPAT